MNYTKKNSNKSKNTITYKTKQKKYKVNYSNKHILKI